MMEKTPTKGFSRMEYQTSNSALCTLFVYTLAMFTLPFVSYFATIYLMDQYFHIPKSESYIYAVIVSVVVVYLIIAAYIYEAFQMYNFVYFHMLLLCVFSK